MLHSCNGILCFWRLLKKVEISQNIWNKLIIKWYITEWSILYWNTYVLIKSNGKVYTKWATVALFLDGRNEVIIYILPDRFHCSSSRYILTRPPPHGSFCQQAVSWVRHLLREVCWAGCRACWARSLVCSVHRAPAMWRILPNQGDQHKSWESNTIDGSMPRGLWGGPLLTLQGLWKRKKPLFWPPWKLCNPRSLSNHPHPSIHPSTHPSNHPSIYLTRLSIYLSAHKSNHSFIHLPTHPVI